MMKDGIISWNKFKENLENKTEMPCKRQVSIDLIHKITGRANNKKQFKIQEHNLPLPNEEMKMMFQKALVITLFIIK